MGMRCTHLRFEHETQHCQRRLKWQGQASKSIKNGQKSLACPLRGPFALEPIWMMNKYLWEVKNGKKNQP